LERVVASSCFGVAAIIGAYPAARNGSFAPPILRENTPHDHWPGGGTSGTMNLPNMHTTNARSPAHRSLSVGILLAVVWPSGTPAMNMRPLPLLPALSLRRLIRAEQ